VVLQTSETSSVTAAELEEEGAGGRGGGEKAKDGVQAAAETLKTKSFFSIHQHCQTLPSHQTLLQTLPAFRLSVFWYFGILVVLYITPSGNNSVRRVGE
jgi:hypothetical protein